MVQGKKIKVFHVLTDRNIGGAGRWLLNYLRYYDRGRFEVSVVLPADSLLCEAVRELGVPVLAMPEMEDKSYDPKAVRPLTAVFRKEKPDIVHTHASMTARMAAKRAGVPKIFCTKHCMEGTPGAFPKRLVRRAVNRRFSDTIIAVSKAVRRSMIEGGTSPRQIVTVPNGIEDIPILTAAERTETLAAFGGKPGEYAVGIAARLEEVKGHGTLLRAAAQVLEKRQDVRFYIIGTGSLREELEKQAAELGIAGQVAFTGFLRDVERMEAALDIAVITSRQEALCLSIIESMWAGVPAVGTDSGGVSEVIRQGETGYLVPVGDSGALAERLLELLADDAKRREMGTAAREYVRKHFAADKMTKRIEKLYTEEQT